MEHSVREILPLGLASIHLVIWRNNDTLAISESIAYFCLVTEQFLLQFGNTLLPTFGSSLFLVIYVFRHITLTKCSIHSINNELSCTPERRKRITVLISKRPKRLIRCLHA